MTPREIIEVLEAFERGEKIEWANYNQEDWEPFSKHEIEMKGGWDFSSFKYRIAKPAPKKMRFLAYADMNGEIRHVHEKSDFVCAGFKRIPSLDLEG